MFISKRDQKQFRKIEETIVLPKLQILVNSSDPTKIWIKDTKIDENSSGFNFRFYKNKISD